MRHCRIVVFLKRWGPAMLMMAMIFYFSSLPAEQVSHASQPFEQTVQPIVNNINRSLRSSMQFKPDWLKLGHVIGYLGLGLAFHHGWQPSLKNGWLYVVAILCCGLYAMTDEFHQFFVDGRSASFKDIGLDTLAATSALLLRATFSRLWRYY